jgi:hypothetical protein
MLSCKLQLLSLLKSIRPSHCACVSPACCELSIVQAHRVVRLDDGRISGIVMEKANGQNVNKTLRDPRWAHCGASHGDNLS